MKALLIIDMQQGSFRPYSLRHDALGTVERINKLAAHFRKQGQPVIYIQHDGKREGNFIPGSDDWKLLPELTVESTDLLMSKTANDCFYKSLLEELLESFGITELYFTGCATDFCVDTTIKSALSKDYKIIVVADGHTTADRGELKAADLIHYYNWLWADMTATKYKIEVKPAEELLR